MNKKYEMFGPMNFYGLRRIHALRNFGGVKKGDVGGWIKSEDNLSPEGNCWVSENARVCGHARVSGAAGVFGNAQIREKSIISDNAKVSGNVIVFGHAELKGNMEYTGEEWVWAANPKGKM